jgi:peptidoglycan/xylan/chitin deacetylase (PgdA/CDA1 family)
MPAEDSRRSPARREAAAHRREIHRRRVRRRRVAALAIAAAAIVALVVAITASGGKRRSADARAAVQAPAVSAAVADRSVRRLRKQGKPVYCGGRNRPFVALTFDDGPGPSTAQAVRRLAALHVPATFFLIGEHVTPFRETVALEARGNAIGNHTFHHVQLTALSLVDAGHEIADAGNAITAITHQPVRLMRPPLGARNPPVDAVARAEGVLEVLWDIDVHDIEGASADKVVAAVSHHAQAGSIILMHENAPQTLASLDAIVAAVRAKHLRPVTVPELMALDPPSAQQLAAGPRGCGLPEPVSSG